MSIPQASAVSIFIYFVCIDENRLPCMVLCVFESVPVKGGRTRPLYFRVSENKILVCSLYSSLEIFVIRQYCKSGNFESIFEVNHKNRKHEIYFYQEKFHTWKCDNFLSVR